MACLNRVFTSSNEDFVSFFKAACSRYLRTDALRRSVNPLRTRDVSPPIFGQGGHL